MENKITSLEELQKEKERMLSEREICKNAFLQSFGVTKSNAKNRFIKVALSASAIGLTTVGIEKIFFSNHKKQTIQEGNNSFNFLLTLLPTMIHLAEKYFGNSENKSETDVR